MNLLKSSIHILMEWITNRGHPGSPDDGSAYQEQTEEEEQVDLFINPWLGVDVVRHRVGNHPRRA